MLSIGYSRTREGDALMERRLRETVELAKQDRIIKYAEAQTLSVLQFEIPEAPQDEQEAKAMRVLVINSPLALGVKEVSALMSSAQDLTLLALQGLVRAGAATERFDGEKPVFALKHKLVLKDSDLKGKKVTFTKPPKITKVVRDDGIEEWTYTLVGDEEVI